MKNMYKATCDHCQTIGTSAFEWVMFSLKKSHEERKPGHFVNWAEA